MLILFLICVALSALSCAVLLRYGRRNARRYALSMPQRFHAGHIPRLGGVGMMIACGAGWLWMLGAERYLPVVNNIPFSVSMAGALLASVGLAVTGGAVEDLTHQLQARWRLVFTLLAAGMSTWLLDLRIERLAVPGADALLGAVSWAPVLLAILAVGGLPHAFNLIDGYNGLAGMVAIICALALGYVCLLVGDRQLAALCVVLAGSTAGFLLWNYPRGFIFAGDGGAYLWGMVIAITSVLLVQRYSQVSPWFPALLLIYPVWETLFSIYRKMVRGQSPSMADALHFHQLIYRRIVRRVFDDNEARRMLMRNNRTSTYLWGFTLSTVIPAALFWQNTRVLMAFCLLFVLTYTAAYVGIVRFKVPRWLRR